MAEKGQEVAIRVYKLEKKDKQRGGIDNIFQLFIALQIVRRNTDGSHTETCWLLPSASLTQQKQRSGTVYPCEHFTFAPGTEIKDVYSAH